MEGYILSGRHGLLNSYEPFIHVIDSMVNQACSSSPSYRYEKSAFLADWSNSTANGLKSASRSSGASVWPL